MIPKIIHYCWFGPNRMPNNYKQYIKGWKNKCPDYKFMFWSEKNFDYNHFYFAKKAYEQGNFAFVSDYLRLYVLKKFGGIYLDTDVELLKSLTPLLLNHAFVGMEDWSSINSGLILGSEPNDHNINNILLKYDKIAHNDKKLNNVMNNTVILFTSYFSKLGFKYKNKIQKIDGFTIYPTNYFCPKNRVTNKLHISKNTYTIHHYDDNWSNESKNNKLTKFNIILGDMIKRIIRPKMYLYLYNKYLNIKND